MLSLKTFLNRDQIQHILRNITWICLKKEKKKKKQKPNQKPNNHFSVLSLFKLYNCLFRNCLLCMLCTGWTPHRATMFTHEVFLRHRFEVDGRALWEQKAWDSAISLGGLLFFAVQLGSEVSYLLLQRHQEFSIGQISLLYCVLLLLHTGRMEEIYNQYVSREPLQQCTDEWPQSYVNPVFSSVVIPHWGQVVSCDLDPSCLMPVDLVNIATKSQVTFLTR